MTEQIYSDSFYAEMSTGSQASARLVVPIIQALFNPRSVVDVGCGIGDWLAEFRRIGVADVAGIDGPWVPEDQLLIPPQAFSRVDLSQSLALARRFDLALCLEVAEHIAEQHARNLVQSLTSLAPVIIFSAAIPFQTGTHHVNEQWPSYWASLFSERGYSVLDCLRPRIWSEDNVEYWYVQNMLAFMNQEAVQMMGELGQVPRSLQPTMLDLVHPRTFLAAQAHISHLESLRPGPSRSRSVLAPIVRLHAWAKTRLRRSSGPR